MRLCMLLSVTHIYTYIYILHAPFCLDEAHPAKAHNARQIIAPCIAHKCLTKIIFLACTGVGHKARDTSAPHNDTLLGYTHLKYIRDFWPRLNLETLKTTIMSGGPKGGHLKGGHLQMGFRSEICTRHVNLTALSKAFPQKAPPGQGKR